MARFPLLLCLLLLLLPPSARATPTRTSTVVVDLNHASLERLQTLPGVGPARAKAIVARRERRPFRRVRELLRIKGIGKKTLRRLRPRLVVTRSGRHP